MQTNIFITNLLYSLCDCKRDHILHKRHNFSVLHLQCKREQKPTLQWFPQILRPPCKFHVIQALPSKSNKILCQLNVISHFKPKIHTIQPLKSKNRNIHNLKWIINLHFKNSNSQNLSINIMQKQQDTMTIKRILPFENQ